MREIRNSTLQFLTYIHSAVLCGGDGYHGQIVEEEGDLVVGIAGDAQLAHLHLDPLHAGGRWWKCKEKFVLIAKFRPYLDTKRFKLLTPNDNVILKVRLC